MVFTDKKEAGEEEEQKEKDCEEDIAHDRDGGVHGGGSEENMGVKILLMIK